MDPKIMAKWIEDTYGMHEGSWDHAAKYPRYAMDWHTAAVAANVPEPWSELVSYMCASGYCDFPDWAQKQLEPSEDREQGPVSVIAD